MTNNVWVNFAKDKFACSASMHKGVKWVNQKKRTTIFSKKKEKEEKGTTMQHKHPSPSAATTTSMPELG